MGARQGKYKLVKSSDAAHLTNLQSTLLRGSTTHAVTIFMAYDRDGYIWLATLDVSGVTWKRRVLLSAAAQNTPSFQMLTNDLWLDVVEANAEQLAMS